MESLEAMTLLSGVAALVATPPPTFAGHVVFNATAHGTYTSHDHIPDVGRSFNVVTHGHADGLGAVDIVGSFHATGFTGTGNATGSLTVHTHRGTLDINATGPVQSGFAKLPTQFTFQIEGGTGKYKGATGSGELTVTLSPGADSLAKHGKVTLDFESVVVDPLK